MASSPMSAKIGFIGGGAMASALMGGLVKAGATTASQITVAEPYVPLREKHAANGFRATASNREVVQNADMVWLAVKPDTIGVVLREVSDLVSPQGRKVFVSIAAGVGVQALESFLPVGARVVRVMPNLPCLVSQAASAFCRGTNATAEDAALVRDALRTVGQAEEVPEKLMDAVSGSTAGVAGWSGGAGGAVAWGSFRVSPRLPEQRRAPTPAAARTRQHLAPSKIRTAIAQRGPAQPMESPSSSPPPAFSRRSFYVWLCR